MATGPWIFGRTVMLPVGVIERIDHENETVYVGRTKDEIKHAPEYDPHANDPDAYRERLGVYYDARRPGA